MLTWFVALRVAHSFYGSLSMPHGLDMKVSYDGSSGTLGRGSPIQTQGKGIEMRRNPSIGFAS